MDKRALLQLDERRRKAEADKMRAITELERRSRDFLKEKKEKSELEERINAMQSQMLGNGVAVADGGAGAGRDARVNQKAFEAEKKLKNEHARIRDEYESKIRELEADRQEAEEGRAQVGRYKAVLLKQRDIMIALTARLNERDETVIRMQEELKAYDGEYRRVEDALDAKTAELIALRRAAMRHSAPSPSQELVDALGGWAGAERTTASKASGRVFGGGGGGGGGRSARRTPSPRAVKPRETAEEAPARGESGVVAPGAAARGRVTSPFGREVAALDVFRRRGESRQGGGTPVRTVPTRRWRRPAGGEERAHARPRGGVRAARALRTTRVGGDGEREPPLVHRRRRAAEAPKRRRS